MEVIVPEGIPASALDSPEDVCRLLDDVSFDQVVVRMNKRKVVLGSSFQPVVQNFIEVSILKEEPTFRASSGIDRPGKNAILEDIMPGSQGVEPMIDVIDGDPVNDEVLAAI